MLPMQYVCIKRSLHYNSIDFETSDTFHYSRSLSYQIVSEEKRIQYVQHQTIYIWIKPWLISCNDSIAAKYGIVETLFLAIYGQNKYTLHIYFCRLHSDLRQIVKFIRYMEPSCNGNKLILKQIRLLTNSCYYLTNQTRKLELPVGDEL